MKSVRKTCLELDERAGVRTNHMWLDPLEEYNKEREKAYGARSRFRVKERDGLGGEYDDDNDFGDDQFTNRRSGKRDNLDEEVVLSSDEEDVDDAELERREQAKIAFLRMSATNRLDATLAYMREKHKWVALRSGTEHVQWADVSPALTAIAIGAEPRMTRKMIWPNRVPATMKMTTSPCPRAGTLSL